MSLLRCIMGVTKPDCAQKRDSLNFGEITEGLKMKKIEPSPEEPKFLRALEVKMHARNRLIAAVYAASPAELERAAVVVKAALRGSGPPVRPRGFKSIEDEQRNSKSVD